MKLYNILLALLIALAMYVWIYDAFLYEKTYVKYLPNYKEEIAYPLYSFHNVKDHKVDDWTKDVPFIGRFLYRIFPIALLAVFTVFIPTFIYGCVLLFSKKKYLKYKWCISQIMLYGIIVLLILKTQIFD